MNTKIQFIFKKEVYVICFLLFLSEAFSSNYNLELIPESSKIQQTVQGKVVDETGLPLPGVTVQIKGSSAGTITNFDGEFTLKGTNQETILVFSFLGYKSKEVTVGSQSTLEIMMEADSESLAEVVVVGYGTQKEENLVNSVSTANLGNIEARPSANIASSLQGAVPGLNIRSSSGGDPSTTPEINIRGFNSLNGGSPLIIVDGIEADIANINPNDIERLLHGQRAPYS